MRIPRFLVVMSILLCATGLFAADRDRDDRPFQQSVFPPELVMANQRKIGLTPEQRLTFLEEMRQTQSDLLPIQLEMSEASADLILLLEGARVDEEAALAAARRVVELEQGVKTRHMVLLIRIKNLLSVEQQRMLREIRDAD